MYSRDQGKIAGLKNIGFVDVAITYHPVNPYNKRRYAWIIKARKP